MEIRKKKFIVLFGVILAIFVAFSFVVRAEDDEEEDEHDDAPRTSTTSSTSKSGSGTKTKVDTSVSTDVKTIIIKDSDGDKIPDSSDPHPTISEIYIVTDDNGNGIVDKFEK